MRAAAATLPSDGARPAAPRAWTDLLQRVRTWATPPTSRSAGTHTPWSSPPRPEEAGLLSRVEALHHYTMNNTVAMVAWLLFFALVLFMELMVVFVKLVFGETVDDQLDRIREQLSRHKAESYLEAMTSPVAGARGLLEGTTC